MNDNLNKGFFTAVAQLVAEFVVQTVERQKAASDQHTLSIKV